MLLALFHNIQKFENLPTSSVQSIAHPIPKQDNASLISQHRPLGLFTNLIKVLERLYKNRHQNALLHGHTQYAYQSDKSRDDLVYDMNQFKKRNSENDFIAFKCDQHQAFDKI
eukprot:NODE_995_length_2762_cov_0.259106.p4 type:complete len:113 gc:universal NODE_995_length_2762_cov_0.259106:2384-2046(-)